MNEVDSILDLLAASIDIPERPADDDILAVLIRAILSQATSSKNRDDAFGNLLDTFSGRWDLIAAADVEEIENAIRVGGLAKQKSGRMQKILTDLWERYGEYSLDTLKTYETDDAVAALESLAGVGPQTATFTVGWALGRDLCPINTGVKRVAIRLGWVEKASDKKMHDALHEVLPDGRRFEAHQLLVRHARQTCLSTPDCDACVIADVCRWNADQP